MAECVFCKLIESKQYFKVYEDRFFVAFLDNAPFTEGHTLVIPKKHHISIWDMPSYGEDSIPELFKVCKKIAKTLQNTVGPREPVYGFIMGSNVPHASIHLIPKTHHGFGLSLGNFLNSKRGRLMGSDEVYPVLQKIGKIL